MDLQALNTWLATIDGYIGGSAWFVYLLLGTGLFFTLYLGFPQIRYFRHAWKIVGGRYDEADAKGDTTHFQSLATALSGTVGTGNIAGVAFAIHLGGPAALFWMLVTAVLGMTTKFVEVTLSHKYREFAEDGTASGGPMYYMKNKLGMKWMAVLFAIATIISSFGTGNMPQVNSIASSLRSTFGIEPWLTGAVLSVLLALIILGGIQRIAATTSKLVPAMALIYFIGVLSVILYNYQNILPALQSIFSDVFRGSSAMGGFLGASMAYASTEASTAVCFPMRPVREVRRSHMQPPVPSIRHPKGWSPFSSPSSIQWSSVHSPDWHCSPAGSGTKRKSMNSNWPTSMCSPERGRKEMSSSAASSIPFTTKGVNCPCSTVH